MTEKTSEEQRQAIAGFLARLPDGERSLYAIIDAGRDPYVIPHMLEAMASNVECLFKGNAKKDLGDQTAWIAEIDRHERLLEWLIEEGWSKRQALFALSDLPLKRFATHLRKFTKVIDADGIEHFFRFYDPQVLRQYLPVFDQKQHDLFFRGITACFVEDNRDPAMILRYRSEDGALVSEAVEIDRLVRQEEKSMEPA